MILLDRTIVVPTRNTTVSLFPFACVHEDNPGHSASKWNEFLWEVKNTPNAYAIGLGDYKDWLRTHAREWMAQFGADGRGAGKQNSFNKMHDWRRKEADDFCEKYLDPIRDRIIGLSLGNHHHMFEDGLNDTMYMCNQLKVPYLGHGFWIRLAITQAHRTAHKVLRILGHHGESIGGGQTIGGDMTSMENKRKDWNFDILMVAHNHKKGGYHKEPVTIPKTGKLKLIDEPVAFIRAGCFVKGYVENCITYAEAKGLMNPTAIGYVRLDIKFKSPQDDDSYQESKLRGAKNPSRNGNLRHEFKLTY